MVNKKMKLGFVLFGLDFGEREKKMVKFSFSFSDWERDRLD